MKLVIQRVSQANVTVSGEKIGSIQKGLVVLIGVTHLDTSKEIKYLCQKVLGLRIFPDDAGKMNLSILDVGGELLLVSQFTLYGDCKDGKRPSFTSAALPEIANNLYTEFVLEMKKSGLKVATGKFGAHMEVSLTNDGPLTFILEKKCSRN